MREFAEFRPMLVGAVLNGTANQFSEVTLQLFADDTKSLTLFLVNRRYRFEQAERRVRVGDDWVDVPQFFLEVDGAPVTLAVYARGDEHLAPRRQAGSRWPPARPPCARSRRCSAPSAARKALGRVDARSR